MPTTVNAPPPRIPRPSSPSNLRQRMSPSIPFVASQDGYSFAASRTMWEAASDSEEDEDDNDASSFCQRARRSTLDVSAL